jgi:hypothetical protein
MLRRFCQVVLFLLLLMAILTPYMQLNSWDSFPVSSDDIEAQATQSICALGMVLVIAGILKLFPVLFRFTAPSILFSSSEALFVVEGRHTRHDLALRSSPLRI